MDLLDQLIADRIQKDMIVNNALSVTTPLDLNMLDVANPICYVLLNYYLAK